MKKYEAVHILKTLRDRAEASPEKIALVDHDGQRGISYGAFYRMINSYALFMREAGLHRDDMVAIELGRVAENHALRMACLFIGVKYVSVNPDYPADRKQQILQACAPSVVMDGKYVSAIPLFDVPCLIDETIDDEAEAYIDFTSGTTGVPKGMLHDRSVFPLAAVAAGVFHVRADIENYASLSDMMFTAATGDFGSVLIGVTMHIISDEMKRDPRKLKTYFMEQNIHEATMLPSMLRMLAPFPTFRACVTAGEKNDYDFSDLDLQVINCYGASECVEISYGYKGTDEGVGRTFGEGRVFLEDEEGNVIDPKDTEKRGEFCYSGPGIMIRYLDDDALTARALKRDPVTGEKVLHTRDMARYNTDGSISIIGRIDSTIKIRGNRVDRAEVEYHLLKCEGVLEAAVRVFEVHGENLLCAFYTTTNQLPLDEGEVRDALAKKMPAYMVPAHIVWVKEFARNVHGKIDRDALTLPLNPDNGKVETGSDPREKKIIGIFRNILKREGIGAGDDFLQSGGSSLTLCELQLELEDAFDVELDVSRIAANCTPAALAAMIRETPGRTLSGTKPLPAEKKKRFPLTDTQYYMYFSERHMTCYGDTGMTAYHMPLLFRVTETDPASVERAVRELLRAHPALRMRVTEQDENPYYLTGEEPEPFIPFTELDDEPGLSFFENRFRPWRVNGGELFRCEVFRHADTCWVFMDIHHLLADGYSMQILLRDFRRAMEGKDVLTEKFSFQDVLERNERLFAESDRSYFAGVKPFCYPGSEKPDDHLPVYRDETLPLDLPDLERQCLSAGVSFMSVFYTACMRAMCRALEPGRYYMPILSLARDSRCLRTVGCLYRLVPLAYDSRKKASMREAVLLTEQQYRQALGHEWFYNWEHERDDARCTVFNDLSGFDISALVGDTRLNDRVESIKVASPGPGYANMPLEFELIRLQESLFALVINYDSSMYSRGDIKKLAENIQTEIRGF